MATTTDLLGQEPYTEAALIPKERYTSKEWLALEYERLWTRVWQMACRQEEIPNSGDYLEYTIGDQSVLLVRQPDGQIKGYPNACLHRGTRLKSGEGNSPELRCRYHGWCWHLDGRIKEVADAHDFAPECVGRDVLHLPEVKVDTWGGFVFINFDPDCEPLLEYLDPIPQWLDAYQPEKLRLWRFRTTILDCNWKTGLDAFNEGYHVQGTHFLDLGGAMRQDEPLKGRDDALPAPIPSNSNTFVYETFERHSVFYMPDVEQDSESDAAVRGQMMGPQGKIGDIPNAREQIAQGLQMSMSIGLAYLDEIDYLKNMKELPLDMEVSDFMLKLRVDSFKAQGVDFSHLPENRMLGGGTDFNFFPNLVGPCVAGNQIMFRFRPNGWDPDTCIVDIMFFHRFPEGEEPKVEKEWYPDWRDHDDWGFVLLQDLGNMAHVQAGMHERTFPGIRLGRQELGLRNHERVLESYVNR